MTKFNVGQGMKKGRLCFFNAIQPYLNNNMGVIKYHNMDHNNVAMKAYFIQWVQGYWQGQNNI
jgi:hypothetical protein